MALTNSQQVVVKLLEDIVGQLAVRGRGVTQAGAIVQVTGIDNEHINAHVTSPVLHMPCEGNIIAPIRSVVPLFQMTLQPAVSIRLW